jgi:hypothetical protein
MSIDIKWLGGQNLIRDVKTFPPQYTDPLDPPWGTLSRLSTSAGDSFLGGKEVKWHERETIFPKLSLVPVSRTLVDLYFPFLTHLCGVLLNACT